MKPEASKSGNKSDANAPFMIGAAIVDPIRRSLTLNNKTEQLTDLTFDFLIALVEAAPDVVTYEELAQLVWKQPYVTDETMAQRLRQLRRSLSDDPKSPRYIRTARGKGYQLIAEINWHGTPITSLDTTKPPTPSRKWLFASMGLSLLAIIWIVSPFQDQRSTVQVSSNPSVNEILDRADEYRKQQQLDANETAIGLYEKVLVKSPNNQRALIGLSFALSHKSSKFGFSSDFATKAARYADKAIVNNPESPGAFAARGMADDARGRVSSAIDYYERSLSLDPKDQTIRSSTAYLLQVKGQFYEALKLEKQVLDNGAANHFTDYQVALALKQVGLSLEAQLWLDRAILLRPDNVFLAEYEVRELIKLGNFNAADALLANVESPQARHLVLESIRLELGGDRDGAAKKIDAAYVNAKNNDRACYECLAQYAHGKREGADVEINSVLTLANKAIEEGDDWPGFRVELAMIQLAMGSEATAMTSLQSAYELGYRDWQWLELSPYLAQLKEQPEFQMLLSDMKTVLEKEKLEIVQDIELAPLLKAVDDD